MKHINGYMIGAPSKARYAIMKKTAFGPIDICSYHVTFKDAADVIMAMDCPHQYEIFKIDWEGGDISESIRDNV